MASFMPGDVEYPGLRRALAAVVALDAATFFWLIAEARLDAATHQIVPGALVAAGSLPVVTALISGSGCIASLLFGRRSGQLGAGLVALASLAVLSTVHAHLFGSPWRHMFFSGVCLCGWLLGLLRARVTGRLGDETFACTGAVALLSAAYFNAGVSKLVFGGVDWLSGVPIQMIIVGQDGLANDTLLGSYRTWVATSPRAAQLFCVVTVILESAAPLMLFSRKASRLIAAGLIAMHANIYLLTHIPYSQSMYLLALFGIVAAPDDPDGQSAIDPRFIGLAAFGSGLALLAMLHQGSRFAQSHRSKPGTAPVQEVVEPEVDPGRAEVGPFRLDQELASGWDVRRLDVEGNAIVVLAEGPTGRVDLRISCEGTEHASPFDLGPLHLFYGSGAAYRDVQLVAQAVRAKLEVAIGGDDPCARVEIWGRESKPATTPTIDSRARDQRQSPPIP